MIALISLALQAAALPAPPADWKALAPLPFLKPPAYAPQLSSFVAGEVHAGRCVAPKLADGTVRVDVPLAVLVTPQGTLKRVVPKAIGCPTVEQYSVGLLQSVARENLRMASDQAEDAWFQTAMTFAWKE